MTSAVSRPSLDCSIMLSGPSICRAAAMRMATLFPHRLLPILRPAALVLPNCAMKLKKRGPGEGRQEVVPTLWQGCLEGGRRWVAGIAGEVVSWLVVVAGCQAEEGGVA